MTAFVSMFLFMRLTHTRDFFNTCLQTCWFSSKVLLPHFFFAWDPKQKLPQASLWFKSARWITSRPLHAWTVLALVVVFCGAWSQQLFVLHTTLDMSQVFACIYTCTCMYIMLNLFLHLRLLLLLLFHPPPSSLDFFSSVGMLHVHTHHLHIPLTLSPSTRVDNLFFFLFFFCAL